MASLRPDLHRAQLLAKRRIAAPAINLALPQLEQNELKKLDELAQTTHNLQWAARISDSATTIAASSLYAQQPLPSNATVGAVD